jgi:hypothetical protein
VRAVLTRKWIGGHLTVVALCVAFVFLGRWQWDESQGPGGDFQNFAYAIQWWLFIVVAVAWWTKIIRDELKRLRELAADGPALPPDAPLPAPSTRIVLGSEPVPAPSPLPDEDPDDAELKEWNAWLAQLNARAR